MNILQINSVCGTGSTGRIVSELNNLLCEQGHESYVAYGRGVSANCNRAIRIGNPLDNYVHVLKTRISDKHGFGSRRATQRLVTQMIKLNPDIIHLHNIHGYYINIQVLFEYLKSEKKPVVWTLHDCWAFTGHCAYFDYIGCDRWKAGCHKCPQKAAYPSSLIMDNSLGNYKGKLELFKGVRNLTIVTPSNWLAGLVQESFLGEYPVKVINNGVNLETFKPMEEVFRKKHNLEKKFIILGVANSWEPRKGYAYFKALSSELGRDEIIVLVGVTDSQSRELPHNILGITRTNSASELAQIYSSADVFLNPTLEDNFPTTNLEALASGTPVITFDTGGSVEPIDNSCGLVVKKGDLNELVSAIKTVKRTGKTTYSKMCVIKARKCFDSKLNYMEYINLYSDILNRSTTGAMG